jgi:CubicO group peptidase (beta-lactamase class C family)
MKKLTSALAIVTLTLTLQAQSPLLQRLDSLTAAYEQNGYHGVILVAQGNKVLYEKGYGLANFEQKIKQTPDKLFKTESVGKMFTAVSILQLVESGQLRLDQTIKELLPESKLKNADKITVHQLLTHTSGLQSPWDHPKWRFKTTYSEEELTKLVEEVPLAFNEPGKEMYYSNSGYVVLGWILEKKTGLAFDQYFQKNIFSKLGMTNTRHLGDTTMPVATGAQPYRIISSKKYLPMTETLGAKASAAGGWISTTGDLHKFMAALYQYKLIKPQTWELMRTANGNNPKDSAYRYYAYGLETYINQLIPDVNLYGHNGGGAGFSIDAFVDPATGYIVTSCTNLYQNSRPIMVNYLKAVLDKPLTPVHRSANVRLYDLIEAKGIDSVITNSDTYLKQLNIQMHPGFIARMADEFIAAKDSIAWNKWMQYGISLYPKEAFLLLIQGDGHLQLQDKTAAHKCYEAAKELAVTNNDQRALRAADEKLKAL